MFSLEGLTRELPSPRESGREPSSPLTDPEEAGPASTDPNTLKLALRLSAEKAPSPASTAPSSVATTIGMGSPNWSSPPPLCKEADCPIKEPHHEGIYRHNGEISKIECGIFGMSNPPPHVWEAMYRISEGSGTLEECEWFLEFQRLHRKEKESKPPATPMTAISELE